MTKGKSQNQNCENPAEYEKVIESRYRPTTEWCWFVAECKYGKIYIGLKNVETEEQIIHTMTIPPILHMAITLDHGEKLLRIIEDWLDCGLDLKPVFTIPSHIHTILLVSTSPSKGAGITSLILGLQDDVIAVLPIRDAFISDVTKIECSNISVSLTMTETNITNAELSNIKKGCVVLIPDSYNKKWNINLNYNNNLQRKGVLDIENSRLEIVKCQAASDDNGYSGVSKDIDNPAMEEEIQTIVVKLKSQIILPLVKILCWSNESKITLQNTFRQNEIEIICNGKSIAAGYLVKVADGFGVYVSR